MAWSEPQRAVVVKALDEYGVESARCERAASLVLPPLPPAREVDPTAVARRCLPLFGMFVCPRRRWFHHVNVFVAEHYVDALSGPDGLEREDYLERHWPDREALSWEDFSDVEVEELAGWTLQSS